MKSNKTKNIIKRVVGGSLITIACITAFYQWRYSKLTIQSKIEVVVAKIDIYEGQALTVENIDTKLVDKGNIVDGALTLTKDLQGGYAKERIRVNEQITDSSFYTAEDYEKKDLRLVSVKGFEAEKDIFSAYEVKPFDKVDLYYFNKEGVYSGKPYLQNIIVDNLKTKDGLEYKNRIDGFIPAYATFWLPGEVSEDMNKKQEEGGYFKIIPHRNKSDYDITTKK